MIKFIINLLKVLTRKKHTNNDSGNENNIVMINDDIGIQHTEDGFIIHAYNGVELSKKQIIDIIRKFTKERS